MINEFVILMGLIEVYINADPGPLFFAIFSFLISLFFLTKAEYLQISYNIYTTHS